MLGWGRRGAMEKRAEMLGRMIALIMHALKSKSYEQFVASFSNPGEEPDAFDRSNRELHFQMRISPTCWYDATAGITVGLHLASGQRAGRDAQAVIAGCDPWPACHTQL
jgi:hypothetical protein